MKYELYNLAVEVTRQCNMGCAHCLRGNAQQMNINTQYIDSLLKDVSSISTITFTGGEPSLNISAIEYTLQKCQELHIPVGSFYIVTNGKENVLPLALTCLKWYSYCDDRDMCGLALSRDKFHSTIDIANEEILRGLAFFREDKFTDFNRISLISEGRAEELSGYRKVDVDSHCEEMEVEVWDDTISVCSMVYLSANGEIRNNCDTAYVNQEFTIGDLNRETLANIIDIQRIGVTLPF